LHQKAQINRALALIFKGIAHLKETFPGKAFTIDGKLVGDIGEVIAALEYDITLYPTQTTAHDGVTSSGHRVQIKATFKDKLTMTSIPERYVGLQLFEDGTHKEIFNGPGAAIARHFGHRAGIGEKQLSFSISALAELSQSVRVEDRVPRKLLT
jgi:hypothetical protein